MNAAIKPNPRIEVASMALLNDPLDFFFADHFRQRKFCNLIEDLAKAKTLDWRLASEVLDFLRHDMVLHVQDEEVDLFPLMLLRCEPEDEIEKILSALTAEHAGDRHLSDIVVAGLEAALEEGWPLSSRPELRDAMIDLARNERRHLALENSIVLPLARRRLTVEDIAQLSASMSVRRGIPIAATA